MLSSKCCIRSTIQQIPATIANTTSQMPILCPQSLGWQPRAFGRTFSIAIVAQVARNRQRPVTSGGRTDRRPMHCLIRDATPRRYVALQRPDQYAPRPVMRATTFFHRIDALSVADQFST